MKDKADITKKLLEFDLAFNTAVAGCDEAGRGPLAGPVVCAACVMPLDSMIEGIDDSKKLTEKQRESLYEQILKKAISCKVSVIEPDVIDQINILNATKRGMSEAINGLKAVGLVLVDAVNPVTVYKHKSIIKGDTLSYNIAAASIVAKVTRDRLMREYDLLYPQYGFKSNKGYGTQDHIAALKEHGPIAIHRRSFIKGILDEA